MGRLPKQTFLQRQTDGQQAHRKIFNITNYQRNAHQNYNKVPTTLHQSEGPSLKNLQITNAEEGALYPAGGNVSWCSPYEKQDGVPQRTKTQSCPMIKQFYSWAYIQIKLKFKKIHRLPLTFKAALFTVAKTQRPPECPLTDEWMGNISSMLLNHKKE